MHAITGKKHFSKDGSFFEWAKSYCRKDLSFVTGAMTEKWPRASLLTLR